MPWRSFRWQLALVFMIPTSVTIADSTILTITGAVETSVELKIKLRRIDNQTEALFSGQVSNNDDARAARDALIATYGEQQIFTGGGTVNAQRVTVGGVPGIHFTSDFEYIVSVEPPVPQALVEPGSSYSQNGLTYQICGPSTNCAGSAGNVPAVSTWGLVITMAGLCLVGTILFRTRSFRRLSAE